MQQQFVEEDIRLVDVLESFRSYLIYLLKKWYISIVGVVALTAGGYYFAKLSAPQYVANISFNALDSRASAMGGLMSMMGVSFAGGSSNDVLTGIFTSRNIFLNSMIEDVEINGKKDKMANFYFHALKYDDGFEKDSVLKDFKFSANSVEEISKTEMDFFGMMYDDYFDGLLTAEYDVMSGVIRAELETPDYEVSRTLGSVLLKKTTEFYQARQLENATTTFKSTSKRLDSISGEIAYRQRLIAQSQDQNIFNRKRVETVDQQKIMQELAVLGALYNDASSSKENAKVGLTPASNIVRVIDDPMFSTAPKRKSKLLFAAVGFAVSILLIILPLIMQKAINDGREEDKVKAAKLAAQETPATTT
ncbi:MAG: hypothetical protein IT275_06220 [Chitinophagales bacterium]|nr:hypothetical protein [Chitinophagales bacterium]